MTFQKGSPEDLLGRQGEDCVRDYLRKQGFYVLEANEINKLGAPMASNQGDSIILPDLLTMKDGVSKWCEVKTKSHPAPPPWDKTLLQHGISTKHFENYLKIETESHITGWLYIVEIESKCLLYQTFIKLKGNIDHKGDMCSKKERESGIKPYEHVFFNRDIFIEEKIVSLPNFIKIEPRADSTIRRLNK